MFIVQNEAANNMENINQDRVRLKQCKYLLKQALDIDESGREDLAIDTYTQAIELSLKVVNSNNYKLNIWFEMLLIVNQMNYLVFFLLLYFRKKKYRMMK